MSNYIKDKCANSERMLTGGRYGAPLLWEYRELTRQPHVRCADLNTTIKTSSRHKSSNHYSKEGGVPDGPGVFITVTLP